jgi:hypothetical protein
MGVGDAICKLIWAIIWLIILLIVALPIGFICAILYVIVSPFTACCNCVNSLADFLEKGVKFPKNAAGNMVDGKQGC